MKLTRLFSVSFIITILILSTSLPYQAVAQNDLGIAKLNKSPSDEFVPGQIIVGLKKSDPNFHSNIVAKGGKVINTIDEINAFVVKVPEHAVDKFISAMSTNPIVDYAEKDLVVRAFYDPQDPFYTTYQWGMKRIGSELAWDTTTGVGSGVKVAVIDTGMNYNHVDLADRVDTANGYDFVDNDSVPLPSNAFCYNGDWEWHATFVAGIIAGIDNDVGIVGASQVEIIPVRVLNNCGSGSSSDVAEGIIWAANHGANVINLSLGGGSSSAIQNAVILAYSEDVVIVASAGNSGSGRPSYPASYDEVISVSATDINDNLASYSTHNSGVELTAPGGDGNSCSTLSVSSGFHPNGGWDWMCAAGTSFSAPHVSGVAALLLAQYQGYSTITNQDIRNHLTLTAEDLGDLGRDRYYGYGMVRSDLAVNTPISGVSPPNNPPTANVDSATTDEDTAVVIDVLINDSNGDGTIDPTTVTVTSGPTNGQTLVDGVSGDITYTPDPDYNGGDSFTYTVQDDQRATSNEALVTISVNPVSDPPTADAGSDQPVNTGDLVNLDGSASSDPDGDPLTYSWSFSSKPASSTATLSDSTIANPTFTADIAGDYVVQLVVNDSVADSAPDTVTVTAGTVENPPPLSGNLDSQIEFDVQSKKRFNNLLVTIVATESESSVSNVPVELTLSRVGASWNFSGITDESGSVTFKLMKARSNEDYTATITNWSDVFAAGEPSDCNYIDENNDPKPCQP